MIPFLDLKAAYLELREPIDEAVKRTLEEAHYILGPEVGKFEEEFANFINCRYCVSVGSGLDALVLALRVAGVDEGDEVIVPSHTFVATWLAVTQIGAVLKPVDPADGEYNLGVEALKSAIGHETKAILCVSLYGEASVDSSLREFADQRNLILIEDAAQAHGASVDGHRAGSLADLATWSFYPAKNLGAFDDGGAVTTNNPDFAEQIKLLRNYGSSQKYHHQLAGQNSRLGSLQSAVLRIKLGKLDEWNDRRRAIAQYYLDNIIHPDIVLPKSTKRQLNAWHLFVIRHPHRQLLQKHLLDNGVQTQIHYPIAPHNQICYRYLGFKDEQLPWASHLANTVLSLPIGPQLTESDVKRVVELVNAYPTL